MLGYLCSHFNQSNQTNNETKPIVQVNNLIHAAEYVVVPNIIRVNQMKHVQTEGLKLFERKNRDYGDAFARYGTIGVLIRMGDKISRLQSITNNGITLVNDEQMRDTLIDLHNYSAMAVMLLDEGKEMKIDPSTYTDLHNDDNHDNDNNYANVGTNICNYVHMKRCKNYKQYIFLATMCSSIGLGVAGIKYFRN